MTSPSKHHAGTIGHFYSTFRTTPGWKRKAPRTREDFERCWPTIEKRFANTKINRLTAVMSETFHHDMLEQENDGSLSADMRHRTLKIWRAILNAMVKHDVIQNAPIGGIANPAPPGRSEIWLAEEIEVLIPAASENGFSGMSLAIWIAWETLYSPIDVRTLTLSQLKTDKTGAYFTQSRNKTKKPALAAISNSLHRTIQLYVGRLPVYPLPDIPFIRQRNGNAYRSKDTFSDDFRTIRTKAFLDEKRHFQDIRRSGNVEADLGGASAEDRGEILANSLASSAFLEETYTPPTVTKARQVSEKRSIGRTFLKEENGIKVGTLRK
jgi:hypothetical protein